MNFEEKNVLITGATKGIGKAIKEKFLQTNVKKIYITGTTDINFCEKKVEYFSVDLLEINSLNSFIQKIEELEIDILINNAGINKISEFEAIEDDEFLKIQQVNIHTPYKICKAVIPHMKRNNWGRIVNISSIFGKISKEYRASYSASKFALDGLTIALAVELASYGILANCVAPGFVNTELTQKILGNEGIDKIVKNIPMKRMATPSEIASFVLWLASEQNTYLTAQNIAIDGGFTRV